jgi:hypothetical protein
VRNLVGIEGKKKWLGVGLVRTGILVEVELRLKRDPSGRLKLSLNSADLD